MKTIYTLVITLFVVATSFSQNHGKVYDELSMTSKILKQEKNYAVYLPPDYETSNRSYPVLYLLHGYGDDQTGWIQFGEVLRIADTAIKDGSATPMIVIMPDGDTTHKGYFNRIEGDWDYETFFFEEFMPHVEKKYRIKSEKRFRAIAGLSMGGGGTFMYALHRPDLFSAACPLSAYIGPQSVEDFKTSFLTKDSSISDESKIASYVAHHNALALIEKSDAKKMNSVRWYIDCGDDDFLYEGNSLVHIAMRKKKVKHEYRVREGRHSWVYWREALPEVLHFVSQGFHQF